MNDNKYFLSFNFEIFYYPNINFKFSLKKFDFEDNTFKNYNEDINIDKETYSLSNDELNFIMKEVLRNDIGHELMPKHMAWLKKFEEQYKRNNSIIKNNNLLFNYLVLKLLIIGFSEDIAKKFSTKYIYELNNYNKTISPLDFIRNINILISRKKFWIPFNIEDAVEKELNFIQEIISLKNEHSTHFNFKLFDDNYLLLCKDALVQSLIDFNSTKSYLVKDVLPVEEQLDYIILVYNKIIGDCLNNYKFYDIGDKNIFDKFKSQLLHNISELIKIYVKC